MGWLGREQTMLESCGSTNDEAAHLAMAGAPHGAVVMALAQSTGRGRMGRDWHSPPGENLYLSCVLRPELEPFQVPPVTLAAGLGVVSAVNSLGLAATLKWPNDVLLGGRKLAGILTEMSTRGSRVEHVIVGIGINLETRVFPPSLASIATSLAQHGVTIARDRFIERLLGDLERWLDRFFAGGVEAIARAWMERAGIGPERVSRVRVQGPSGPIEGRAVGIDGSGFLLVAAPDGQVHRVLAGDVAVVS